MDAIALRFVKWGSGLLVLGLWTGYGPLHHYLHGGVETACPWAPVHAHVVLLGWVGFTLFGLVYRALPRWGTLPAGAERLAVAHFWASLVAVLGVLVNGLFGYRLLDHMSPGFYYVPDTRTLNLWLLVDGAFLTLFALATIPFLMVVLRTRGEAPPAGREPTAG